MPTADAQTGPWAVCAACKGQAAIRDFGEHGKDHTDVCGACGGTGYARLRDPESFGRLRLPHVDGRVPARYVRLAESMLETLRGPHDAPLKGEPRDRIVRLAALLQDFERFVTVP
jgi:hypothetical protein